MLPTSVLRHRGFRNLFIGQSISQLGDALYYVVFMYMVKRLTNSDPMVGFVGAVEAAPFVLFSGYAGVIADRLDRKKIMLYSDWLCAGILALFALVVLLIDKVPVESVFVVAFLTSSFRVFFYPAKNAAIPNLVPLEETLQANTLNAMSFNLFFALGLTLSTIALSALFGLSSQLFFGLTVLLNALSFAVSAFYIRKLPAIIPDRGHEEPHPWVDFKEGLKYIRRRRVLTVLMFAGLFMSLAISPFFLTYVAANDAWFGGQPNTLTLCELSFFVGMIIGSAVLARLQFKKVGFGYALGLGMTGVFVAIMAGTPILWVFCLLNFLCGLFIPFADIPVQSYVQIKVEDVFRGRVNSALMMLRTGMMPLGMTLGGLLIGGVGLVGMFLIMGLGMVAVAAAALLDPAFRASNLEPEVAPDSGNEPLLSEAVA
jgi:DHA3 family macrolide efflux protein-like MFS transporter